MSTRHLKIAIFLLCLLPVFTLGVRAVRGDLGANPVGFVTHSTGDWTLRFLLATLAITPARNLLGAPTLIRFRRMFGLFAFFYGCLHFVTYIWFDKFFDIDDMLKDVAKRPFITVGVASLLFMVPLAVTSTAAWIRRLGGKRWQRLHRLVYPVAAGGVIHYYWLVKSDVRLPLRYGAVLAVLLAYRLFVFTAKRRPRNARSCRDLWLAAKRASSVPTWCYLISSTSGRSFLGIAGTVASGCERKTEPWSGSRLLGR